jgi:hypothetical protein
MKNIRRATVTHRPKKEMFTVTLRYSPMNQADALYMIARAYPGGLEQLSLDMGGMSVNVLRNKVRPTIDTHHCSDEETSRIMELCEDKGMKDATLPLIAKNWRHGLIAFPKPSVSDFANIEMTMALCHAVKEFSGVAMSASGALADNNVSVDEFREYEQQAQEALAAIHELTERMRAAAFPPSVGDRT